MSDETAAVAVPAEETVPAEVLAEYEAEHADLQEYEQALAQLQAKRSAGERLTDAEYQALPVLPEKIADTKRRLEPLVARMAQAEAKRGMAAAIAHHNQFVEPKREWHEQLLTRLSLVVQHLQAFPALDAAQKSQLSQLQRADGRTFPTLDPSETLQNILSRLPHASVLAAALVALMQRPITKGDVEQVADIDSGTQRISAQTVRRFLEGR